MKEPGNILSRHEMVAGVRDTVINIWTSASIPISTPEGITYKINKIIDRYIIGWAVFDFLFLIYC